MIRQWLNFWGHAAHVRLEDGYMDSKQSEQLKQKQNSFKTALIQPQQPWNVLAVFANHSRYPLLQTAVYDAVNQTLVNKHGDYIH